MEHTSTSDAEASADYSMVSGQNKATISLVDWTFIYPVYNEEETVEKTLQDALTFLKHQNQSWEIIFIDNASKDKTKGLIAHFQEQYDHIHVIHHSENFGYATSIRSGLRHAKGKIIFTIDGDAQHTLQDIPHFIDKVNEGYDVVFGWKEHRKDPWPRLLISSVFNYLSCWILETNLHDINCGFRAFRRDFAKTLDIHHQLNFVGPEILIQARFHQARIAELPVTHFSREAGSSCHNIRNIFSTIRKVLCYLFKLRRKWKQGERHA